MKNRANIAASILQNSELLKSVYESSQNSSGSAEEELSKYLDSIEGKIQQFTNEVQEFWYNLVDSEFVKGVIDAGTKIIDIIGNVTNKLGGLGTVVTAITAGASLKGILSSDDGKSGGIFGLISKLNGKNRLSVDFDESSFNNIITKYKESGLSAENFTKQMDLSSKSLSGYLDIIDGEYANFSGYSSYVDVMNKSLGATGIKATVASVGMGLLNTALSMGVSLIAGFALNAIITALDEFSRAAEIADEKMNEAFSTYEEAKQKIADVNTELETTKETMSNLEAKGGLTFVEEQELEDLREATELLQIQADLAEKEEEREAQKAANSAVKAYNKNFKNEISEDATNEYATMTENPMLLMADDSNISAMIAFIRLMEELQGGVEKGSDDWNRYDGYIEDATEQVWEQVDLLSDYQDKLESIPTEYLTEEQAETLEEIKESIKYVYTELDPEKWQQLQFDKIFNTKSLDEAKQKLVSLAKEKNGISVDDITGEYSELSDAIEEAGFSLQDLIDNVNSEAEVIDTGRIKEQIKAAFSDISNEELDSLGLSDLKVAAELLVEVDPASFSSFDEFLKQVDYSKYLGENVVTNSRDILDDLGIDINPFAEVSTSLREALKNGTLPITQMEQILSGDKDVDNYISKVNELKIALGKLNDESLTDADLKELMAMFPDWTFDTKNLEGSITNLIRSMNSDMISKFSSQFDEIDSDEARKELEKFMSSVMECGSIVGSTEFAISFDTESESIESLNTAMQESVSSTGLSAESITNLKNRYAEFIDEGYDINQLFEETYNGIHLNKDALNELEQAYANRKTAEVQNDIDELSAEYERLTLEIENCSDAQLLQEKYTERESVIEKINDLGTLMSRYEGLTSAYKKWQDAQSNGEEGDLYDSIRDSKDDIAQLYEDGLIGTNEFRTYVDLLSNADLSAASGTEVQAEWQRLNQTITGTSYSAIDFLNEGSDGVLNLLNAVQQLNPEWAKLNSNGKWDLNFGFGNDEEIAKELGVDVEFLQSMLRKLTDYSFDINLDSVSSSLADLKDSAKEGNDVINSIFDEDYTFNFETTSLESLTDDQLPKAREILDSFRDPDTGQIDLTISGAYEAETILVTLLRQKQELTAPAIMNLDNSSLEEADADIANAISLLQQFTELSNTLEIEKELKVDTSETETKIQNIASELSNISGDTWAKINIDEEGLNQQLSAIGATDLSISDAHLSEEAISSVQSAINGIDVKAIELPTNSNEVLGELQEVEDFTVHDKKFSITLKNNPYLVIDTFNQQKIEDKTYTIKKTIETTYKSKIGGANDANGTANSLGFGFWRGTAFANGNWGAKTSGVALGGEVGQELVVRDGRFFTIGDNGAEFFRYKKDDIIFNAGQTAEIFKYGKIKNGKKRGEVFAQGNAFTDGTAFSSGSGTIYAKGSVKTTSTGSSSSSGSGNSDSADSADDFSETLDWIERKIKDIERDIENLDQTVSAAYKSWSTRNSALTDEIALVNEEISVQQQAYQRYLQEANSVGLSETYKRLVQNGKIDIETITDEDLANQIQDYQEWYDKMPRCLVISNENYLFNCWESVKTITLQRKNEISLSVNVTKVEKSNLYYIWCKPKCL